MILFILFIFNAIALVLLESVQKPIKYKNVFRVILILFLIFLCGQINLLNP